MFKTAGHFDGKILETMIAESRFNSDDPNAFDVCLKVEGPEGQTDWWRGEFSARYGRGNFANKTQAEIAMGDLQKVGFEGNDLTELDKQLKGKTISFTVESREYENKTYYDVKYIGGGDYRPKAIDPASIAARMAAIQGAKPQSNQSAPKQETAAGTSVADSDPWG